MSLSNKVAIVTGAAQGLGKAFSEALLKRGAKVGMSDMNEEQGQATLSEFSAKYGQDQAIFMKCDVTNEAQMEEMFKAVKERLGGLDIVVNNAGMGCEMKGWEKTIDVNVQGTLRGCMLAMGNMRKDKGGKGGVIVNISSMAGINPNPCGPVYAASKAAIIQYSLSWAVNPELAGNGVRMNVLCPAFADTNLVDKFTTDPTSIHVPQLVHVIKQKVGLMTPEYVAENMMLLIEDETKNGAVMNISQTQGVTYHKP